MNFIKDKSIILKDEYWKQIDGYPDYLISNMGRLYFLRDNKLSKATGGKKRYIMTVLTNDNTGKRTVSLHILVAEAFLKEQKARKQIQYPDEKLEVNHKNGNKKDNRVVNLEWTTHKENMQHSYDTKIHKIPPGKQVKIQYIDINGKKGKIFNSVKEASKFFNCHTSHINRILNKSIKPGIIKKKGTHNYLNFEYVNKINKFEDENDNEIWKIHPIHTHLKISTEGRIININTGGKRLIMGSTSKRYNSVHVNEEIINGKKKYLRKARHRLVAETFLPNFQNKSDVDHINNNTKDNRLWNLRWTTHKENCNSNVSYHIIWNNKFKALKNFRKEHKRWPKQKENYNLPNSEKVFNIGRWCQYQRDAKKGKDGKSLTNERISKLNSIGFPWKLR